MNTVIVRLDTNHRVTTTNRAEQDEVVAPPFLESVHPLDRPAVEAMLQDLPHVRGVACLDRVMIRVRTRFEWSAIRAIALPGGGYLLHLLPATQTTEERRFLALVNESIQREQELARLLPVLRKFSAPVLAAIRDELAPLTPAGRMRARGHITAPPEKRASADRAGAIPTPAAANEVG